MYVLIKHICAHKLMHRTSRKQTVLQIFFSPPCFQSIGALYLSHCIYISFSAHLAEMGYINRIKPSLFQPPFLYCMLVYEPPFVIVRVYHHPKGTPPFSSKWWQRLPGFWYSLRIIGPSKLAILRTKHPCVIQVRSNPSIGGSKILRVSCKTCKTLHVNSSASLPPPISVIFHQEAATNV